MDIALIRTFLEVSATGSFANASERLLVTQSAVSLRIQRLEDILGQALFTRSKAGAELTPAGHNFERFAYALIRIWEEARQEVAIPEGFTQSLTIGAQYSLWPRLGFRWIDALRAARPDLALRAELGMPERLTRFLVEGVVQVALIYTPQLRPHLRAERVLNEELVLVASWPDPTPDLSGRYVMIDWGPEFIHAHALDLPHLTGGGLTMALGALAGEYIVRRQAAGYLPARSAKEHIDAGRLHLVPDAPKYPYPAWAVWRDDLDPALAEIAGSELARVCRSVEAATTSVMSEWKSMWDHDHPAPAPQGGRSYP